MTVFRTKALKRWTQAELTAKNLDFSYASSFPLHELVHVWFWELDRELGTVNDPFVTQVVPVQNEDLPYVPAKVNHAVITPLGLKYRRLGELVEEINSETDSLRNHRETLATIHAFEIDWTVDKSRILDGFRIWLEAQENFWKRAEKRRVVATFFPKKGRRDFCDTWLRELAIFRIASARLNYKEGVTILREIGALRSASIELDSSNWSHAKHRSQARILIYKQVVESLPGYRDRVTQDMHLAWNLLKSFSRPSVDRWRRTRR